MNDGYGSRAGMALGSPSANMSWTQLGAATVFVLVVIVAWRQVVSMIMREI